ncbi:response regulator [Paenibacillus sp. FSL R5-0519]|uniref:response regulator n=1 Tax=Paenibacillus sp. FSL R5-0519 TaxID=2921648 RepID=UPI0030D7AED0
MKQTFSMVVVDDIPAVVDGIAHDLPWGDHAIEVVGTAYDGLDGLKLIQEKQPDIIVTDIRMPKLSGIEMIEQAKHSGAKLIFISGYSDFSYAQQVLNLGGFDYILKPFTPDELLETICRAKAQLEKEKESRHHLMDVERKLRESMPLLRQEYLNLLVRYSSHPETVKEKWNFLNVNMNDHYFTVFTVEMDNYYTNKAGVSEVELQRFSLQNILEETIRTYTEAVVFRDDINRFVCIVNDRPDAENDEMLKIAEACRENVERYTRYSISIGVGTKVEHIHQLPITYQQAMYALSYNFYTGGNSVFAYPSYADNHATYVKFSSEKERELVYLLRSGATSKINEVLDGIFSEWKDSQAMPTPDKVKVFWIELMVNVRNAINEDLELEEPHFFDRKIHKLTYDTDSITELQSIVAEICHMYCENIGKKQKETAHVVINESIAYIRDHLHLNESVADYAKQVHLSTSYYSNLFKKVTNQSVLQFVVQERIEKAKILILQGITLQEVAMEVGYDERSYFSDVFKKKVGMTPSEFKKQYQN